MQDDNDTRYRSHHVLKEQAAHEAGHYATACAILDLYPEHIKKVDIDAITIVQRGEVDGSVNAKFEYAEGSPDPLKNPELLSESQAEPWVIHCLGGIAAQQLWKDLYFMGRLGGSTVELPSERRAKIWGLAKQQAIADGGGPDLLMARVLLNGADVEPYFMKALEIVRHHWAALYRVAQALLVKRTLSGEEAHAAFFRPGE